MSIKHSPPLGIGPQLTGGACTRGEVTTWSYIRPWFPVLCESLGESPSALNCCQRILILFLRPMIKVGDAEEPVKPEDLFEWLRERGLYWSCWCAHQGGPPRPTKIVCIPGHGTRDQYAAYCHYVPSRCSFERKSPFFT